MNFFFKRSFFYLSFLSFGISICFTFQLSNLTHMFKFLGANDLILPWLWLAPPLTGLIVQPIIGQLSDDTNTRFGKRQPYILMGGICVAISFIFLALSPTLGAALFLTLIIDCGLNTCSEGLRALTGDLVKKDERSSAFAMQAMLSGLGGAIGAGLTYILYNVLTYLNVKVDITPTQLPFQFKLAFIFSALALLMCITISLLKLPANPFKKQKLLISKKISIIKKHTLFKRIFISLFINIKNMPKQFSSICFVHALSWTGVFIFWLYLPVVIAQNFFHLMPLANLAANPDYAETMNKASLLTSSYLPIYLYTSVIYSMVLYYISTYFDKRFIHMNSLLIGGVGLIIISFVTTLLGLSISLIAIGVMWGSLIVLPYSIVMEIFPKGKLGVYLGIFNISITIPQIISSLCLPLIYKYLLHSHAQYVLCLGGVLTILSALGWFYVSPRTSYLNKLPMVEENV